tara:strand:- start:379 stop:771 length:393 start_codon:yes stop_codon:yes gene_type:complete
MFTIYLLVDLKKNYMETSVKGLIKDSAILCNCEREYFNYETDGINCEITSNNMIYTVEFFSIEDLCNYIDFIKSIKTVIIDSIFYENSILYASNKYLKNLNTNFVNRENIKKTIFENRQLSKFSRLYKLL